MIKVSLVAVSVLLFLLSSCSKEISLENDTTTPGSGGGNGGVGDGTKLVRLGIRTGADSVTVDYSYNSANLLNGIVYSGSVGGIDAGVQTRIVRNASNIITSLVTKGPLFLAIGIDSFVSTYAYDAARSRYSYNVTHYNFLGLPSIDSVEYIYNSNNLLTEGVSYYNDGSGYEITSKEEVSYNGNNLASMRSYAHNGNNFELEQTVIFDQFDTRINPLQFKADAVILGMPDFYPANNLVKRTVTDHTTPASVASTVVYTYNAQNRPVKAVSTSGATTTTMTYYYQ